MPKHVMNLWLVSSSQKLFGQEVYFEDKFHYTYRSRWPSYPLQLEWLFLTYLINVLTVTHKTLRRIYQNFIETDVVVHKTSKKQCIFLHIVNRYHSILSHKLSLEMFFFLICYDYILFVCLWKLHTVRQSKFGNSGTIIKSLLFAL